MTDFEYIRAGIIVLAVVGFYHCLTRALWLTLIASAGFAAYLSASYPPKEQFLTYWVGGVVAVVILSGLAWYNRTPDGPIDAPKPTLPKRARNQKEIVIDGTNVLYWDGDGADLMTLQCIIAYLRQKNYNPFVFLDASSRHHLGDKSLNEKSFAKALGLGQDRVMVCPAKTEADAFILRFAKQEGLPVLSNDRFGDRSDLAKGLKIVKGVMANGRPLLEGL